MLFPLLLVMAIALRLAGPYPRAGLLWIGGLAASPALARHLVEQAVDDYSWRAGQLELVALEWTPEPTARELSMIDDTRYIPGIRRARVTVGQ